MEEVKAGLLRYRVALGLIATLLLFIVVTLPFSIADVVSDVFGSPYGRRVPLPAGPRPALEPSHAHLNLALVGLDEVQQLVTLRVSGHQTCQAGCTDNWRLVLFSLPDPDDVKEPDDLPPSAAIALTPKTIEVTESVQLPIMGQPLRFPFDVYALRLGVALQRVGAAGTAQPVPAAQAAGHLVLTVQEQLPRLRMLPPRPLAVAPPGAETAPYEYLHVHLLQLERPMYLRVLSVLLVLLVTAAAAYAVFLRPLQELVVNSGALVLGVWGIRQILVPSTYNSATAVDLSLSVVILFLLGAITVRALMFAHERAELHMFGPTRSRESSLDE